MDRPLCSVDGCSRAVTTKGMCAAHYHRAWRGAAVDAPFRVRLPKNARPSPWAGAKRRKSGCWDFAGLRNKTGYGYLQYGGERHIAHRLAYELTQGPIPVGLVIAHDCDRPSCIRPGHLFLTTVRGNDYDKQMKGRGGAPGRKGRKRNHWRRPGWRGYDMRWFEREKRRARLRQSALLVIFARLVAAEASAPQVVQSAA